MKSARFLSLFVAALAFAGWYALYTPPSPTQDLPPVSYTAFKTRAPDAAAGQALAAAARTWGGVTAATYNHNSNLLVLAHHQSKAASGLQSQLEVLSGTPMPVQDFSEIPAGPGCPIPHEYLSALPGALLALGIAGLCVGLMLMFKRPSKLAFAE